MKWVHTVVLKSLSLILAVQRSDIFIDFIWDFHAGISVGEYNQLTEMNHKKYFLCLFGHHQPCPLKDKCYSSLLKHQLYPCPPKSSIIPVFQNSNIITVFQNTSFILVFQRKQHYPI